MTGGGGNGRVPLSFLFLSFFKLRRTKHSWAKRLGMEGGGNLEQSQREYGVHQWEEFFFHFFFKHLVCFLRILSNLSLSMHYPKGISRIPRDSQFLSCSAFVLHGLLSRVDEDGGSFCSCSYTRCNHHAERAAGMSRFAVVEMGYLSRLAIDEMVSQPTPSGA